MTLADLWRLLRCDDAVATGRGDDLIVGRVATIDEGTACVSGCDARGVHASRWCEPDDVRHADDAEAEMYRAWQGLEMYRDVFPHACAWIDAHAFQPALERGEGEASDEQP
jgi:hypothetical protein